MRKRNVKNLFDTIFWYLIYAFPLIAYLINTSINGVIAFESFITTLGFDFVSSNVITQGLVAIFGSSGILPLFITNAPLYIFAWFVWCLIIHVMVDALAFLPRLCHSFEDSFTTRD